MKTLKRKRKNQHVIPFGLKWAVKGEGNIKHTNVTNTKLIAIYIARKIAKNQKTELVIHGRNGRIQYRDSYGNDPNPPRG